MFKIVLDAGHGINTAGKRCLKSIDPNQTREWTLNDRICDKIESYLTAYEGYSVLRVDDTTGEKDIALATRVTNANKFGADVYISVHHNAGINGGSGGGVMAFTYTKVDATTTSWQTDLYNAIISATGLKGNRATPLGKADFYVLRKTTMPAVLLECGFMDSTADTPVILTETYADKVAKAIVDVIVKKGGLTKKVISKTETTTTNKIYRVQVGAYSVKVNAENMVKKLKADGYDAIIV